METKNETTAKPKTSILKVMPQLVIIALFLSYLGYTGYNYFVRPTTDSLKSTNESAVMLRMVGSFSKNHAIDADKSVPTIKAVCGNPNIKTVIFHMHSEGGSGTEAERIANAITKHCGKKETIALIESSCFSACYQVAVRADRIAINAYGDTGAVGTYMSWTDYSKQLDAQGVKEVIIASGSKKGPTFGTVMLNQAQADDFQKAMNSSGTTFVAEVERFRKGKLVATSGIAEGGIYASDDAIRLGLVDEIKTVDDIRDEFPGLKELDGSHSGHYEEDAPRKSESKLAKALEKARAAVN